MRETFRIEYPHNIVELSVKITAYNNWRVKTKEHRLCQKNPTNGSQQFADVLKF